MSRAIVALAALCLMFAAPALPQSSTSSVLGSVTDASGSAIVGATVTLVNEGTQDSRTVTTDATGSFLFASILPGTYTARVESEGFQAYERRGIGLSANERLPLGAIPLTIGAVTETISVTADAAVVQTESSESSAELSSRQLSTVSQRGRNVVGYLKLMPGVNTSNEIDSSHGGGGIGTSLPNVGGVSGRALTIGLDGQQGQDNGSTQSYTTTVSLDAIAEVKVLLNNYQAEYGRNGGAMINVVTKSGSRDFHGSAYWYKRHEMFNAQNFFNNRSGLEKPRYRHNTLGATLGGPVMIPGVFNKDRQKLFFFVNVETNPSLEPRSIARQTMPTALERMGDFSQSLRQNGKPYIITDPATGQPFANNIIPADRINTSGQALLNLFSQPNELDPGITNRAYNYEFQDTRDVSRTQQTFRIDYKATDKDSIYFRGTHFKTTSEGYNLTSWDFVKVEQTFLNKHASLGYTRVISPSMVNELNLGVRRPQERLPLPADPQDALDVTRAGSGFVAGQLFPNSNPDDIIPRASFGGVPSAPNFGSFFAERFPQFEDDINWLISDNLTYIRGNHTFKFGFYGERDRVTTGYGFTANWMGNYNFGTNTNNPLDTGNPYSNALLGNFQSYTENTNPTKPSATSVNIDWFAQDSWKVTNRFTLELGLRVAYFTPWDQTDGLQSSWALSRYNPSSTPLLFQPGLDGSTRVAVNPLTGETLNSAFIGAFVPGTGDVSNGFVTTRDPNYPAGFYEKSGEMFQPRFGFAFDVFGDGKTAVRGGFGLMNQLVTYEPRNAGPPISFEPVVYNQSLDTFLNSEGVLSPGNAISHDRNFKAPGIYNMTLGVQHNVGFGTVLDVRYVGTLVRNLTVQRNINELPYGTRFLPSSLDPTTNRPLPDNFLRPYPGFGNIEYREGSGSSNYHALQVKADHRLADGLQFGVAYTFSKTMDYGNFRQSMPTYLDHRRNYGKSDFDQTHVAVINYSYDLPTFSQNAVAHAILGNWQVSGISTFASGTPEGIDLETTNNVDLTGGGDGQRVNITGDPRIAHGERGIDRMFNTSVFALPGLGDIGNAAKDVFRGPGVISHDLTLFKNIPLKSEQRTLQLRWEIYNLFNHTNFQNVDNTARFNPSTGEQVNARFGQATSARDARVMQVSLRFLF
jgi:hypothetical protein